MGFLDKASSKIMESFGDETVRVVDYGRDPEENSREIPRPKSARPRPKEIRPSKRKVRGEKKPKTDSKFTEDYEEWGGDNLAEGGHVKLDRPEGSDQDHSADDDYEDDEVSPEESAFSIDESEENYFNEQQRRYEESVEARFSDVPDLTQVRGNEIQDVLEVLDVKPTFAIEKDIFLPEDIEDASSFDLQAPYGFEQGQVRTFVERTKVTVDRYVGLLKQRNVDVAKLASVVDRLQVDLNNMRFQNEIANGINVMPTADAEDLENRYMEAKLKIKRLEDRIHDIEHGDDLTNSERETFNALQDELSISERARQELQDEVYSLRTRLAYLEEDGSDDDESPRPPVPEAKEELPPVDEAEVSNPLPSTAPTPSSAFYVEDDDSDEYASQIEILNDSNTTEDGSRFMANPDDDDDDQLEALMRDWNKN